MTIDEEFAAQDIYKFLDYYEIKNDQSERLNFSNHPYLLDIYGDFTPHQAILKAAQIGMSTTINVKALWLAKNRGMDIIYSLPSASDIRDFVSGKTNRLIDNNPILQAWTSDKDSTEQKRVGANVIYFKGTWTERAAIATPADLYISDETDRSKQDIVAQYQTRLQHSKFGWQWYFSNPSAPGVGVDRHWQLSDQKHWFVSCGCGERQFITMKSIQNGMFVCMKCGRELDRHSGEWVRKHNDRDVSGYWISLLMCPWVSAQYVLDKQQSMSEEQFANFVLGQPYIGRGNVLTREMFVQNLTSDVNPMDARVVIGVDTGVAINYVCANRYGTFFYDKCSDYAPIRNLLLRWPNAVAVIDQGGDIIGPRKLREEFPNRVFLCFFRADRKNDELVTWNDEDGTVTCDRNRMIQLVVDEFAEKRMPVYGTEAEWHDYLSEWLGMYRTVEESVLQTPVHRWNKPSSGRCDFPFASVYLRVGLSRFIESRASLILPGSSFAFTGLDVSEDGKRAFLPKV
jgi:hypothetical protein